MSVDIAAPPTEEEATGSCAAVLPKSQNSEE